MLMSDYVLHQSHHPYHLSGSSMSAMSSDTMSGSVASSTRQSNRVRTVRLVRPNLSAMPPPGLSGCRHGPNLGFSIRGGREHGTGFFVSHVELGSEAHRQGLRVGDQIVRINGFTVEDAVHKEVLQLISNHTHLTFKVRSVGMIPVKDKRTDPLSWQIISDCNSSTRSSPQLGEKNHDVRITMNVAPRSKLGCGICKGPDWKPGIFIQFTKEGGHAREAGLRPGDQILSCNNVDFGDIAFNEAVNLMKSSRQLDLIVRKSAGSELFPGESSGYNSSASSVTGDQSPSWSESKRLSIVKEESMDLEDRLTHLQMANKKWEKIEWDDVDADCCDKNNYYKPTIINLSEHGTTIKNNGTIEECKQDAFAKSAPSHHEPSGKETKTVVVEIHRTDESSSTKNNNEKLALSKTPSISSFTSSASRSSTQSQATSLSSAISQELLRRSEKHKAESTFSIDEQLEMKKNLMKNVDTEKQEQHHKLMDEFRKAHKKMFKSNDLTDRDDNKDRTNAANSNREFSQKINERLAHLVNNDIPEAKPTKSNHQQDVPPPPPPLPLPAAFNSPGEQMQTIKPKQKAPPPPVPVKTSTLSSFSTFHQPPPCPTPDYDTLSLNSNSTLPRTMLKKPVNRTTSHNPSTSAPRNNNTDAVEMESLDSFAIHNPASNPKPPPTYFHNGSIECLDVHNTKKPLSNVTIGEYAGTSRKAPGKFDFLHGNQPGETSPSPEPVNALFASELAQTLHRSNLRRRTDSMENLLNHPQITRNDANGSVRISVNNNGNRQLNMEAISKALTNRVKINVTPDAMTMKKNHNEGAPPNGILKNGSASNGHSNGNGQQ